MIFEIFEVFNAENKRLFFTTDPKCVPPKKEIEILINGGHKVKVNDKILYKKNIDEFLKNIKTKETK